ncbi:MAG: c-type cytochrome [Myxococcaceae bacterium]|nr:c-type cytochrome [Myxococcaceae bacterium]
MGPGRSAIPSRGGALWALVLAGCGAGAPLSPEPPVAGDVFAAELGGPLPGVSASLAARFERGRELMQRHFAPAEGLGPAFSASACGSCHEKPVLGGAGARYRDVFVRTGPQGQGLTVAFQPQFEVGPGARAATPSGAVARARRTGAFFGAGLLAELPARALIANADPRDADGDGVSGAVNFDRGFVGRFGRKAQQASLQGFVRLALSDHLGLTSDPVDDGDLPGDERPAQVRLGDEDAVADPELPAEDLSALLAFAALLAPPRPAPLDAEARVGFRLFQEIRCAGCHVPALEGPRGPVPAYSDLLLHDLGDELADGVTVLDAQARELRTAPLWGVGLGGPYLHDGRADTVEDAVLAHGGEALGARQAFAALPPALQAALLHFLGTLGGGEAAREGLLPPGAPVPPPLAPGGPLRPLDEVTAARFARGRALFDRDVALSKGLGPAFNADSCRGCHSAPVLGGAGPDDVDVIRQGTLEAGVGFVASAHGTIAHRHQRGGARPEPAEGADLFERRQTPPLFGLGLIDGIPESAIVAREDPTDADGDGVRGRARRLRDGRVGRFGWKAQVASLAEFTVDALSNELGLTVSREVQARTSALVGFTADDDGVADPELSAQDVDDLVAFLAALAPLPQADPPAAGQAAFATLGCATCHVPRLPGRDGTPVLLHSDLLLHDVAPADARLVPDGEVDRAFRTPPLWGVGASAPYLHDGRAPDLSQAVLLHDGEALRSRKAFEAAPTDTREALLAYLRSL